MPRYRYKCPEGHEFECYASYNADTVVCEEHGLPAERQAVYRDQAVIFRGGGWTRSVVPPAPPDPPSSAGESTDVHFEKLDEFAEKQYKYDRNVRPAVKERRRGRKQ